MAIRNRKDIPIFADVPDEKWNEYLEQLKTESSGLPIDLVTDLPRNELIEYYRKAKWIRTTPTVPSDGRLFRCWKRHTGLRLICWIPCTKTRIPRLPD